MTETITAKEVKDIVTKVTNAYDPSNVTAGGHAKFSKFSKNDVELAWKDTKELHVELGGAKIPVSQLDEGELTNLITNMKVIQALANGFPPIQAKKKVSKSLKF